MLHYVWPIALVVLSNVFYQVCAKSVPGGMNPLASLTITYVIGAVTSFLLYYALNKDASIIQEYSKVNWASFILGFAIVGLEVGYIYAYKAGWPVSSAKLFRRRAWRDFNFCGYLLYQEAVTWNKLPNPSLLGGACAYQYK